MSELSQTEEVNTPFLHLFVFFGPSTDWVRPTHNGGGAIRFTQSTDSNVGLYQKHPHRHTQKSCLAKYLSTLWPSQVGI